MPDKDRRQEFHIDVEEVAEGVDLLAEATGFSKRLIKEIMQKGAVWVSQGSHTRRLRRASKKLSKGVQLHLYYAPHVLDCTIPTPELIADEGDYSVWCKPRGMLSQGSKWGDHNTITRWAEKNLVPERPAFCVHRLDRATEGLIIVAHGKKATRALTQLFRERGMEKQYQAIVHGDHRGNAQPQTIQESIDGKMACSHVTCLDYDKKSNQSHVQIRIETGRKHQIRRHLAGINLPIVGDRLYGGEDGCEQLQLVACQLAFICPLTGNARNYAIDKPALGL